MTVILTAAMLVVYLQIITSAKMWRGLGPATTKKKGGGFVSTKLVLPLLVVLPDKPGNPVTPITAGYTTYTCECGDSYTGHEHSYTEETTEPRCTQAGYTIYTCSCGDSYWVKLPALVHDYVFVGQSGMMYKTIKFQQKAKSIHIFIWLQEVTATSGMWGGYFLFLDFPRRKPSPNAEKISVRRYNGSVNVTFIWSTHSLLGQGARSFTP